VGEGPGLERLKQCFQSGEYADRHLWQAWTPNVLPYFEAIDILAMPTIGLEAFGRVSLEAQACGVPVLCSNSGGIPETLIADETGLLLPPGDIQAWRDAILKVVRDEALRHRLGNNGRKWVKQKFSTTAIAKDFTQLLLQE
jgi:glycosyltransferase involved in cell wall biosynthesis